MTAVDTSPGIERVRKHVQALDLQRRQANLLVSLTEELAELVGATDRVRSEIEAATRQQQRMKELVSVS